MVPRTSLSKLHELFQRASRCARDDSSANANLVYEVEVHLRSLWTQVESLVLWIGIMTSNNPFGWSSDGFTTQGVTSPPLPQISVPTSMPELVLFNFSPILRDSINCTAFAPHSRPFLYFASYTTPEEHTACKDHAGNNIAVIEWGAHPIVQIKNLVPRQYVQAWLKLSPDKRSALGFFLCPLFF